MLFPERTRRRQISAIVHVQSPANRRIENRQRHNREDIWSKDPWRWYRILFLTHPYNRGGCCWCGNPATVVEHSDWSFYGTDTYLDFWKAGCEPMCSPCNRAKRRGLRLCPRCRRQGHYAPEGELCWDCRNDKELLLFRKDKRKRSKAAYGRATYRRLHGKKIYNTRLGKWVTVK
jgi:hypothetical protein